MRPFRTAASRSTRRVSREALNIYVVYCFRLQSLTRVHCIQSGWSWLSVLNVPFSISVLVFDSTPNRELSVFSPSYFECNLCPRGRLRYLRVLSCLHRGFVTHASQMSLMTSLIYCSRTWRRCCRYLSRGYHFCHRHARIRFRCQRCRL